MKKESLKRGSGQDDHLGHPERSGSSLRKERSPRGSQSSGKADHPDRERRKRSKEMIERSDSPESRNRDSPESRNRTRQDRGQDSSPSSPSGAAKPERSSLKKDTTDSRYSSGVSAARSAEEEA